MGAIIADESGYLGRKLSVALAHSGREVTCVVPRLHLSAASVRGLNFLPWHALESGTWHPPASAMAYYISAGDAAWSPRSAEDLRQFAALARAAGADRLVCVAPWTVNDANSFRSVVTVKEIAVSEIRVSPIIGQGSPAFEMIRSIVERLPVIPCAAWTMGALQPVSVGDVVQYLLDAPQRPLDAVCLAGSSVETYTTLMSWYARSRRLPRLMLPLRVPRMLSLALTEGASNLTRTEIQMLAAAAGTALVSGGHEIAILPASTDAAISQALTLTELPKIGARLEPDALRTNHVIVRRDGFIMGQWQTLVAAPSAATFAVLESMGGERGWLFADELWQLRGWIDRALGGPGMSRGRTDPLQVEAGSVVDFWRVERTERGKLLRFRAEMKMPGEAWLEFECDRYNGTTLLRQTIYFQPRGLAGELYWAALYPFHLLLFDGMHRAIALEARRRAHAASGELAEGKQEQAKNASGETFAIFH